MEPALDPALVACLDGVRAERGRIVVLTGAGISAQSGIPTFRGPEGYWTIGARHYHPMELATAAAFATRPRDVWSWYLHRRSVCHSAAPNSAHLALVELHRRVGDRFTLVTQNVDGLHLRAGHDAAGVFQIHGNIDFMRCADACDPSIYPIPAEIPVHRETPTLDAAVWDALVCPRCGSATRPHVLWFDEVYDEVRFQAESALRAAAAAQILIVVGTAGTTNLPLQIATLVARAGVPIVDVNIEDGPFARLAARNHGYRVRATATAAVPLIVERLA